MNHCKGWILVVVAAAVLAGVGTRSRIKAQDAGKLSSTDWPCYRGPTGDGISTEQGWNSNWAIPPKQLWTTKVGKGYSSVTVAGGKLYTMGNADGTEDTVWCLDAKTGKEIWKKTYPCSFAGTYPGPRATPTVDEGRVYTISRNGQIICWDAATGDIKWQKDAKKDFAGHPGLWAFSNSGTIAGKNLIVDVGAVVALDKATGDVVWKSTKVWGAGYATPTLFKAGGKDLVAVFEGDGLKALSLADGKTVWEYPWKTPGGVNAATPVLVDGKFFITSGYGVGCALVNAEDGKEIWKNKELASQFTTPVLYKGFLYGINGSPGKSKGKVQCLDLEGKTKWAEEGYGIGSLMLANGKLIIQGEQGQLAIAEAAPEGFKKIAETKALPGGTCWTMPVLSGGVIYCRNMEGDLAAIDVSDK